MRPALRALTALLLFAACTREGGDVESRAADLRRQSTPAVVELTRDADWRLRTAALLELRRRADDPLTETAARACLADSNPRIRVHAVDVVRAVSGRRGALETETLASLVRAIEDPHWSVRAAAIEVLGASGGSAAWAAPDVAAALDDPHEVVRTKAVWALGEFGAAARPELDRVRRMVGDPDPIVRLVVPGAVEKITTGEIAEQGDGTDADAQPFR